MDDLLIDGRAFLRTLIRQPRVSSLVMGILALGIAAAVVVYSVVEALVLDPYPDGDALVVIGSEMPRVGQDLGYFERLSGPEIETLRQTSRTLEHFLPFDLNSVRLQGDDFPQRLFAIFTWADPFPCLGLTPALGRSFNDEELRRGDGVTVISHSLWQRHFAADPKILGHSLIADGTRYTIVGVAPPASTPYGADLWLPGSGSLRDMSRQQRQLNLLARRTDRVDAEALNADLRRVAAEVEQREGGAFDEYIDWRLAASTWTRFNAFAYEDEAVLALGAILFVLLLVAANLANLLLSRAAGRRDEIRVRQALGASRRRILRQVFTESTLFAFGGGLLGLVLAALGLPLVVAWLPQTMQAVAKPIAIDGRTLLFAAAATLSSALICSLAPALHFNATSRVGMALGLTAGGRASPGHDMRRSHRLLVVVQVAMAVVLLSGAGALVVAWSHLATQDLGFDAEQLISMRISLPNGVYEGESIPRFFEDLQDEVALLPTVRQVSVATQVAPNTFFGAELQVPGIDDTAPRPMHTVVGDGYFQTMGLEMVRGRPLDPRDRFDGPCALVINRLAADGYFPGRDPLGEAARVVGSRFDSGPCEIVGIVEAVRHRGPLQPPGPEIFTSHRQAGGRYNQMFLVLRTDGDAAAVVDGVRRTLQRLDPDQPLYAVGSARQAVADQLAPQRVTAHLLAGFAVMALLLAAFGIYGVVAFGVARRQREMSLRLALGARDLDLTALVVGESLRTVAVGLVLGGLGAWALSRLLRQQLPAVAELPLWSLLLAMAGLTVAAVVAAALPAHRATRAAPAEMLKRL